MATLQPVISDFDFAEVWNDLENFPNIRSVAEEVGQTLLGAKKKASKIRERMASGDKNAPILVSRSNAAAKPIPIVPEMQAEHQHLSVKECIGKLQALHFADPDRNITRLSFRSQTGLADSSWSKHFGTFLEFKRQAGLQLNRGQHQTERHIAKHVSVDHYREFNDRRDLDNKYMKKSNSKIRTVIGCSDLHDQEVDPFYLRVLIETCRMVQPDVINLGGDIFDLPEFGKFAIDPREWDVVGRIRFAHENILKPLREACPDAQIDFVEGNHEFRLLRHMADATPALQAVLSDLLGLTVSKLLGLDDFEINYIAKGDLSAYTKGNQTKEISKSYINYNDAMLVHHHPHARHWGLPGWNGHHHSWQVWHQKNAIQGGYSWMQLPAGHRLKASYCEGEFWNLGFNIGHINTETKSVTMEPVIVTDMACVGGLFFYRQPEEMVGFFAGRRNRAA